MFETMIVNTITGNATFMKPRKEIGRPRCADIDATTTFALRQATPDTKAFIVGQSIFEALLTHLAGLTNCLGFAS